VDLLFDTARRRSCPDARWGGLQDDRPAIRAASFNLDSMFAHWHAGNPDWRTVERGPKRGTGSR